MYLFCLSHFNVDSLNIISLPIKENRRVIYYLEHTFDCFSLTFYKNLLTRLFASYKRKWLNKINFCLK